MKKKTRRRPSPASAKVVIKAYRQAVATHDLIYAVGLKVDSALRAIQKLSSEQNLDWKERAAALMLEQSANTKMINRVPKDFRFGWWARLCLKASGHFTRLCYRPDWP